MSKFLTFVGGALFGAAIGAGTALMMAPKAGEELRKDVRSKYDTTVADVQQRARETREMIEVRAADTRAKLNTQLDTARTGLTERKERIVEAAKTFRDEKNEKVETVA